MVQVQVLALLPFAMRKLDANTTMYYHPTWAVSKLGSNISFIFRIDSNKFENHNIIQMACQVAAADPANRVFPHLD
jgi:hypothetical protein